MQTYLIILAIAAAVCGWTLFGVTIWLAEMLCVSTKAIIRLQEERHAKAKATMEAMAQQIALMQRVNLAMAQELHRRGFNPPDDSSDADWWKKQ